MSDTTRTIGRDWRVSVAPEADSVIEVTPPAPIPPKGGWRVVLALVAVALLVAATVAPLWWHHEGALALFGVSK